MSINNKFLDTDFGEVEQIVRQWLPTNEAPNHQSDAPWQNTLRATLADRGWGTQQVSFSAREICAWSGSDVRFVTLLRRDDGGPQWVIVNPCGSASVDLQIIDQNGLRKQRVKASKLATQLNQQSVGDALPWLMIYQGRALESLKCAGPSKLNVWKRLRALAHLETATVRSVLVYAFVVGLLTLATPLAVQSIVNTISFGVLLQPLVILTIVVFFVLAFAGSLRILETIAVEFMQRRLFVNATTDLVHRIHDVDTEFAKKTDMRELVNRFFDVVALQKSLATLLLDGAGLVLQAVVGLLVLAFYHPLLLAFDIVLIVIVAFIVGILGRGAIRTSLAESKAKYAVVAWLERLAESITNAPPDPNANATTKADQLTHDYLDARESHFKRIIRQLGGFVLLQAITSAMLLGLGGWLVMRGQLTLGQLVAAEIIVTAVVGSLTKFTKNLATFYDATASIEKVGKLIDIPLAAGNVRHNSQQAEITVPGFSALMRVASPKVALLSAKTLAIVFAIAVLFLAFIPWQQTSQGSGRVIAYSPVEREQTVKAPITGQIAQWHVQEGVYVKKGDPVVDLADNDPNILERLGQEQEANERGFSAAGISAEAIQGQIQALIESRRLAIAAADARIRMAINRIKAAKQKLLANKATAKASALNKTRQEELEKEGLASRRAVELSEMTFAKAQAAQFSAQADLAAAQGDLLGKRAEREKVAADIDVKIAESRSYLEKARGEIEKRKTSLIKSQVALSRQAQMQIRAPRDGTIVRVLVRQGGEYVKAGDPLFVLVSENAERAVTLWIDGNDVPLVHPGRHVRMQFEGWPAVQFSGWPAVAVGTFGGEVAFVDATAEADGKFRVVVIPGDESWPEAKFLRQGARANGWIMLNRVSLGYEIWRKLNGFPPTAEKQPTISGKRTAPQ